MFDGIRIFDCMTIQVIVVFWNHTKMQKFFFTEGGQSFLFLSFSDSELFSKLHLLPNFRFMHEHSDTSKFLGCNRYLDEGLKVMCQKW